MLVDISHRTGAGYGAAVLGVAVVTAIFAPLHAALSATTVALAYLLVVLFVATVWGRGPAMVASVLAMLCFNFFFLPPIYTFTIADPQNWVALAAFLVTAITAGHLSERAKRRGAAAGAARAASAYNRSLIEASLDPLVTIGADGRILDVNTAAEAVTGRPRDELIGTDFSGCFTEPVADRMRVGGADRSVSGERGDEHEERRAGQVEIGEQAIDDAEAIPWCDEQRGFCVSRCDISARCSRRLQRTQARRADRDDIVAAGAGAFDRCHGRCGNAESLAMHAMLCQVVRVDWLEGSGADMQGQISERDSVRFEPGEEGQVEMQARCRRGDSARIAGVNGLIPISIVGVDGSGDIRGQRNFAMTIEIRVYRRSH